MLNAKEFQALDRDGYVLVQDALDGAIVLRLRRAFELAPPQKSGTQHVQVDEKTAEYDSWRALEKHPAVCAAAKHVLDRPFRVREIHGRNPLPGFGQQGLHTDWPTRAPDAPYSVVTAIFLFDDFTKENGATRVIPGTHRLCRLIPKSLRQPLACHGEEHIVTGRAGSVLIFNGHLWHSGRKNESTGPRRVAQMVIQAGDARSAS